MGISSWNALSKSNLLLVSLQDSAGRVNSLDFHRSEELLVTAGDDDSIRLYNTLTGEPAKSVYSRKYGVANICFTHDSASVIYTSTKVGFRSIISGHASVYVYRLGRDSCICWQAKLQCIRRRNFSKIVSIYGLSQAERGSNCAVCIAGEGSWDQVSQPA